ncbi:cell division cycle 7-related protein kinase-like isoform X2 [Dysidea avara]|uniref:cell division cycle 7-related protein kinase-like isoform X2 n=1 Tax=Dysidea avara TaxID=196820 RepID=UPI00332F453E
MRGMERRESNASFIALPSDQIFDETQDTSQKKRRRTAHISTGASGGQDDSVEQFLSNVPEIGTHFNVLKKIGTGTFSTVYLACLKEDETKLCALKHVVQTSVPWRIENEIQCLTLMSHTECIMSLETFVRHGDHVVLIMPFFEHDKFQDYINDITISEVQQYMKAMLTALQTVHSYHIIHRDIKPSNFLYSRKERKFKLVDFGLAQVEPSYTGECQAILKGPSTSSSSSSGMLPTLLSSRAVRMSPRLANKRTAQLRAPQPPSPAKWRSCKKENTVIPASNSTSYLPTTSGYQSNRSSRTKKTGGGARVTAGNRGSKQAGSRSSALCKHRSSEVCNNCTHRLGQKTPRAGTPGFRPPEVLLKYPSQTTAVDIWSAGVILLCLLSGKYPFFKAHDDLTAMMQIVSLMGTKECEDAARQFGKELNCSPSYPAQNLSSMCQHFRASNVHQRTVGRPLPGASVTDRNMIVKSLTSPIRGLSVTLDDIRKVHTPPIEDAMPEVKVKLELVNGDKSATTQNGNIKLKFCRGCINSVEQSPMVTHSLCSSCIQRVNKQCSQLCSGQRALALRKQPSATSLVSGDMNWVAAPDSAYDLLKRCLDLNPATRITATEALCHPFLKDTG